MNNLRECYKCVLAKKLVDKDSLYSFRKLRESFTDDLVTINNVGGISLPRERKDFEEVLLMLELLCSAYEYYAVLCSFRDRDPIFLDDGDAKWF